LGGSVSSPFTSFGLTRQGSESQGSFVSFVLDPKDPAYQENRRQIESVNSAEQLRQLAVRRPELAGPTTTSQGTGTGLTTDASVLGLGLRFTDTGSYSEQKTVSAEGVTRQYEGSGGSGADTCLWQKRQLYRWRPPRK
jgi:hypothetical protein